MSKLTPTLLLTAGMLSLPVASQVTSARQQVQTKYTAIVVDYEVWFSQGSDLAWRWYGVSNVDVADQTKRIWWVVCPKNILTTMNKALVQDIKTILTTKQIAFQLSCKNVTVGSSSPISNPIILDQERVKFQNWWEIQGHHTTRIWLPLPLVVSAKTSTIDNLEEITRVTFKDEKGTKQVICTNHNDVPINGAQFKSFSQSIDEKVNFKGIDRWEAVSARIEVICKFK